KIQMADETVIATYSPIGNSAILGYQVVKTPIGGEGTKLSFKQPAPICLAAFLMPSNKQQN
ncbi:hypothetical protein, partial [Salmonella enterica]